MFQHTKAKWLYALLIFCITVLTRYPLVDNLYQYSFEGDSEPCINITRSFYFFFKNPCFENAPQSLSGYPTYFDGDYICAAITANLVRPLVKKNILEADLGDGNDSLIIFSMRWNSVLFNAGAAVLAFLSLTLLTSSYFLCCLVVLMSFIWSSTTINTDLIRVDHYLLFAAMSMFYFALKIFKEPGNKWNFIGAGFFGRPCYCYQIKFPFLFADFIPFDNRTNLWQEASLQIFRTNDNRLFVWRSFFYFSDGSFSTRKMLF